MLKIIFIFLSVLPTAHSAKAPRCSSLLKQHQGLEESIVRGLIIRSPHIDHILDGNKTWEIRGSNTKIRGRIALIQSGTRLILGTVELVDSVGPLTPDELMENADKTQVGAEVIEKLSYQRPYVWILRNPIRLENPVNSNYPNGSVIWVTLVPNR